MLFRNLSSKSDPVNGFELIEQCIERATDRREDFGSARLVRRLRAGGGRARKRARFRDRARTGRRAPLARTPACALLDRRADHRPGDMLLINNRRILHNRTAFEDHAALALRRHYVRLCCAGDRSTAAVPCQSPASRRRHPAGKSSGTSVPPWRSPPLRNGQALHSRREPASASQSELGARLDRELAAHVEFSRRDERTLQPRLAPARVSPVGPDRNNQTTEDGPAMRS
jgi:hypothetical protein